MSNAEVRSSQRSSLIATAALLVLLGAPPLLIISACADKAGIVIGHNAEEAARVAKDIAERALKRGCFKPGEKEFFEEFLTQVDKAASNPEVPKSIRTLLATLSDELHTLDGALQFLKVCE